VDPISLLRKATPVLVVERIEPVLGFWHKVGMKAVTEVPGEGGLVFVILAAAGLEIMYQTAASVRTDLIASSCDPGAFRSGSPGSPPSNSSSRVSGWSCHGARHSTAPLKLDTPIPPATSWCLPSARLERGRTRARRVSRSARVAVSGLPASPFRASAASARPRSSAPHRLLVTTRRSPL